LLTDVAATDPMVFCRSQSTAGVALLTGAGIRSYASSVCIPRARRADRPLARH
jgi:hypothetical protein